MSINSSPLQLYIFKLIETFLKRFDYSYEPQRGFLNKQGLYQDEKSLVTNFLAYAALYDRFIPSKDESNRDAIQINKDDFKSNFSAWKESKLEEAVNALRERLSFDPKIESIGQLGLSNWLESILWRKPNQKELAVMSHFLHQVKRKLFNKKVKYHLMPIIVAGQGSGKTESVKWLVEPVFGLFFKDSNLEALEDARNDFQYARTYVIMLDELSKANRADVSSLKQKITATEIQTRLFHSQDFVNIKMNTTFIATSNESVDNLISDKTGMRRYFQLIGPIKNVVDSKTFEEKQAIWGLKGSELSVHTIWKSIDENIEILPAFMNQLDSIVKDQEELRFIDNVEDFVKSKGLITVKEETADKDGVAQNKRLIKYIYKDYQEFCIDSGEERSCINRRLFSKRMQQLGFIKKYARIGKETGDVLLCRVESLAESHPHINLLKVAASAAPAALKIEGTND